MTQEQIIEGNKSIDEFMDNWLTNRGFSETELNYNSDWNCLMEVVEKINEMTDEFGNQYDFHISNGYVWVDPHIGGRIFFSGNEIGHREEPMIQKVFRGVVEFIKWYNDESRKNN